MSDSIIDVLVGSTGFVGGNLLFGHGFNLALHSTNVEEAFHEQVELLVYAGVPSAMFLANNDPDADLEVMKVARDNIQNINADKTVLISTIAVYADSRGKSEDEEPDFDGLAPYGSNRLQLEKWVRQDFPNTLIIRLPALYGIGLKKNFIFDMSHIAPSLLSSEKYMELSDSSDLIASSYFDEGNGFWRMRDNANQAAVNDFFLKSDFNALSFTDSRSRFQFYDLKNLWRDIDIALNNNLDVLNIATPPVLAADVYERIRGNKWDNQLAKPPFDYDMRTKHSRLWGREDGYVKSEQEELSSLASFVKEQDARVQVSGI